MRFFADHCVSTSTQNALRDAGHEVIRLRDRLPPDAPDPDVLAEAQTLGAVLLTLDGDFADIVAYPPAATLGIVALQVRGRTEAIPAIMDRLVAFLEARAPNELKGTLLLAEPHRIRIVGA
ncbi:MAG: DUF5615 family PIN-like protein [Bacteroidota bacterium]